MKNKILTMLVLLLWSGTSPFRCGAQSLYGNYYHDLDSVSNLGVAVRRLPNGHLFLFGGGGYYLNSSYVRLGGIVLSTKGDSLLEYHLQNQPPANFYYTDFGTLLPQVNGDLITHQSLSYPSTPVKNYKTSNASVVRFHPNGDTEWVKTYTDTNMLWQAPEGLSQSSLDSSFVMSGFQYPATGRVSSGYLMFLDSAAQFKRQMTFRHPNYGSAAEHFIQRAAFLPDGKRVLALCGARTDYTTPNGLSYSKFHPWLFICDTQGVIQKQRILPRRYQGGGRSPFSGIDKNGGFYMGGSLDTLLDPYGQLSSPYNDPPFLMHLDTNLNTEWVFRVGDSIHSYYLYTVKQLHNDNYLIIGKTYVPDSPGSAGWLAVVNTDGTLKWSRRYHKSTQWNHVLFDAIENPDGSITAVGSGQSDTAATRPYDLWILNVDSNGCEGPGVCSGSLSVEEGPPVAKEDDFKIYPNPTSGALYVESAQGGEATLYNLLGTVVWHQTIVSGKTAVSLPSSLAAGVYVVRFVAADGAVSQTRLMYQP